jgi:hypothetical protein
MEESRGEQCTVVFVLIVTEPASVCGGGGGGRGVGKPPAPQLADSVTIYAKTTDGLFPRFLLQGLFCSDLEDVLTLQTKLYRCAHIFLGKCLPPVTSRRNPLLRTAYGISPDRNLRDRQVLGEQTGSLGIDRY